MTMVPRNDSKQIHRQNKVGETVLSNCGWKGKFGEKLKQMLATLWGILDLG
jgi:hypothetical protein